MYRFFGKWVLNDETKYATFTEPAYELEPIETLRLHPENTLPKSHRTDQEVMATIRATTQSKWSAVLPAKPREFKSFRKAYGVVLSDITGVTKPSASDLRVTAIDSEPNGVERLVLGGTHRGDAVPATLYHATGTRPKGAVVLVHDQGTAAFTNPKTGELNAMAQELRKSHAVLLIDVFLTGTHSTEEQRANRASNAHSDTFLPTDTSYRIQDIVTALAYLRSRDDVGDSIRLAGFGDAGIWCLFASALDGRVDRTVIDANEFNNNDDVAWAERHYIPCVRSSGDVATAAALIAPHALVIHNTGTSFDTQAMENLYGRVNAPEKLTVSRAPLTGKKLAAELTVRND